MTPETIDQKVRTVIASSLGVELTEVVESTRLAEDLGVDSFGALELMFEIEEAFGLKVTNSEFESVRSVGDVVAHVRHGLAEREKH